MVRLNRGVWVLGFVSLFMDLSSEMIHALLPILLTSSLGASVALVGLIEGSAEALTQIVKLWSGWLSDRFRSRKGLTVLGYGLAALVKPLFPVAGSAADVLVARLLDRLGKGIRGAPRDAMLADMSAPEERGAAFGLRQSLDTLGAFIGPLLAVLLLAGLGFSLHSVLWVACVPAFLAVALVVFGLQEPARSQQAARRGPVFSGALRLGGLFWQAMAVTALVMLARFSEAFLILRAVQLDLAPAYVPLVLVVMSLAYAVTAYPAGRISDHLGRKGLLLLGLLCLGVADLMLALGQSLQLFFAGLVIWGLHMGLTQGLLTALVADTVPAQLRGTGFGLFGLISGVAALAASVLAGLLWQGFGSTVTFLAGAAFSGAAMLMLVWLWCRGSYSSSRQ